MAGLEDEKPPVKIAEKVGDFKVSPDAKRVAFTRRSDTSPDTYDLWLAAAPASQASRTI